ncbi:hypothetical protein [Beduini massiliensis]|uniref:hypothetical protein n=1 Tax=Beduini massiliensis TaxID=1585974 RepID=UPI00059A9296|nr:hypothetical protein [Beduini massiliensis]
MKNFKAEVHKRILLRRSLLAGVIVIEILLNVFRDRFTNIPDYAFGYQVGVLIGMMILLSVNLYMYERSYRNDERLKMLYIKEHDERKILIKSKMAMSTLFISIGLLGIATLIAVYINQTVAFTLISVIYGMGIILCILKVYYAKKY